MFCKEQVSSFLPQVGRIRSLGAELHFIGTGDTFFARGFRDEYQVPVPIYVDPERKTYQALGFARTARSTVSRRVLRNARRAMAAGHHQTKTQGDAWQQGGVMVVLTGGRVAYSQASAVAGDHPDVDEVVGALEACAEPDAHDGTGPKDGL